MTAAGCATGQGLCVPHPVPGGLPYAPIGAADRRVGVVGDVVQSTACSSGDRPGVFASGARMICNGAAGCGVSPR
jgi:hypothetical protein